MIIKTHKKFELWSKVGDSFVKANYLVTDMNSNIVGAYITKREAEAQQRIVNDEIMANDLTATRIN